MSIAALWTGSFEILDEVYFQTDWGEEFGGKSIRKINKYQDKVFTPLGVKLVRIPKDFWITLQLTTLEVGGQHVLDKYSFVFLSQDLPLKIVRNFRVDFLCLLYYNKCKEE